jgi:outer membrane protein TolC
MRGRRVAWLGLAWTTAACAHYTPAPLDPAASAQAYAARRLDAPDLSAWLATRRGSDTAWTSATLGLVALYYQPAVARARAARATARAAERTAGAPPQPDVQGELGYATSSNVFESRWLAALSAVYTVELGGKRGARLVAARARTAVAETDLEDATWRTARAVRAAAVELAGAEERLADASVGVARVSAFAARLRRRYEEGTLGRSELAAIEVEEADARAGAGREEAGVAAARVALALVAGLPPSALDGLRIGPEPPPECAAGGSDSLQALALRRRPEVGRALAEYAVAEGDLRVAVAGSYPDLSLGPGYTWDQGIGRWSLLFGLPHLPIGGNRGPIAEGIARRRETAARFAERQQAVLAEVAAAVAGCRVARADVEGAESVRAATERRAELARAAYERGEIGVVELEPLEFAETRALRDLHAARERQALAALAVETATGAWPPGTVAWEPPPEATTEEGAR